MRLRVVIADDHALFAEGLRLFLTLGHADEFEVVGIASDGGEAVELAVDHDANVVVMDLAMPGVDGLEATRRLVSLRPQTQVVVISDAETDDLEERTQDAGAAAAIAKDRVRDELVDLIRGLSQSSGSDTTT